MPAASNAHLDAFLRRIDQRDPLSEEERRAILGAAGALQRVPARTDLVRAGEHVDKSILLTSGYAIRYGMLRDGGRQITALHVSGDFVDLHGFLLRRMDHSVGTLSDCTVVYFPHEALIEITRRFPHLTRMLWLLTLLDGAIHRQWLVSMGRMPAVRHLAHLLCELYVRLRVAGAMDDERRFLLPIAQHDLADMLGLSAVHVNRVVQELRSTGLISWEGQMLTILDWDALQHFSGFDPAYLYLERESR